MVWKCYFWKEPRKFSIICILDFVRDQLSCCWELQLYYYKYLHLNLHLFNWLTVTGKSEALNVVSVILCVCVCFCEVPNRDIFFKLSLVLSGPLKKNPSNKKTVENIYDENMDGLFNGSSDFWFVFKKYLTLKKLMGGWNWEFFFHI